ncbi:MAG: serine/threonine protein kinase [Armatimonadetes bacterium]|nr:serine/threonine protein kinase [Armatimonadota bacterium]
MKSSEGPVALREGTVLDERYAVGRVLGRGGFGLTYAVEDLARGTPAVVKELAPLGSVRGSSDEIEFAGLGPAASQRLRHQFTAEARQLQRVRIPRVPQFRSVFHEHQTAYYATDYIRGAKPLSEFVGGQARLEPTFVESLLLLLMETLGGLHDHGILHRDVKPSNVLLAPSGEPYLVDFGSARQWHADLTAAHAVQFTPGYAPLEQLLEQGRRGPATDLYGLGATTYALLAGYPPTSAVERADGAALVSLSSVRPDVPTRLARAIERLLELHLEDRPQSVAELREILSADGFTREDSNKVRELDSKRRRLRQFRYDAMQCPSCGDVLETPTALPVRTCPVCRDGLIRKRRIEEMSCPSCRGGILSKVDNRGPLHYCPSCKRGRMARVGRFRFRKPKEWKCEGCGFVLVESGGGATDADGRVQSWQEWREQSGRQERGVGCDACLAQFDVMPDGRWLRVSQDLLGDGWTRLLPDEWARVAAGLSPDAGNAYCEACESDFFVADGYLTLLTDPVSDPYGFAGNYCGELIAEADLPYFAVGKESGRTGMVCTCCGTEFDSDGEGLTLVRSPHARLRRQLRECYSLEDWHRTAQDLPQAGHEGELAEDIEDALAEAWVLGEVDFDPRDRDLVWRGEAAEVKERRGGAVVGRRRKLVVRSDTISFGGLLRRRTELVRDVERIDVDGDRLRIHLLGEAPWELELDPVTLTFRLESGKDEVEIGAEQLARRLTRGQASAV